MWIYRLLAFFVVALALPWLAIPEKVHADGCVVDVGGTTFVDGYVIRTDKCDENGATWVSNKTQAGGEHIGATEAEGYQRVRGDFLSSGKKTADAQIKAIPGHVSHMVCQGTDATATAGSVNLYDALTETGTPVYTFDVHAVAYPNPQPIPIMVDFATGIYLGFTTTADMSCHVFSR